MRALHNRGYFFWANVIQKWDGAVPIWKIATEIQLNGALETQWNSIITSMRAGGIYRSSKWDFLIWKGLGGTTSIQAKQIYLQLLHTASDPPDNIFPTVFWKTGCPIKIIIFAWLAYYNRNLTWENLQKQKWYGPAICPICRSNSERNLHIFLQCPQTQFIWQNLATHFGFTYVNAPSITKAFTGWSNMYIERRPITLLTIWAIGSDTTR